MMNDEENIAQDITGKVVIGILLRYKYLIITTTLIMTVLAGIFAYLEPSVYVSSTSIKLKEADSSKNDLFAMAIGAQVESSTDEIALIQSELLANKVLDKIELGTRYFYKNKYKTHELYKESPFILTVISMQTMIYGKPLYIEPIDNERFILKIKDTPFSFKKLKKLIFSKPAPPIVFSQEYKYGEEITTKWFKIKIQKISQSKKREYFVTYLPNRYMGGFISHGLSAGFLGPESSVLNISYVDTVPQRAQEIVDAVTQTYFEDEVSQGLKATEKTISYLDTQLDTLGKILNKSATKLKSFKQTNTDITLENIVTDTSNKVQDIKVKLRELEYEENILANLKTYIETGKDLSSITLSETESTNKALIEKIARYQELNETYRKSLTVYTEFHPEVIKAIDDLNRMKESIQYLLNSDLKRVRLRKSFYVNEISALQSSLVSLPEKERELAGLSRNVAVNEKIYSFLLEKRTEMKIVQSSTTPNVRILAEASIPGAAIKPNRTYITILGSILGFVLGSAIAFLLYARDDTIKTLEEIENAVEVPFMGLIPFHSKGKYTNAYAEAFRTLRTNLEFLQTEGDSKTVLLASSISGEGKSTTIKNLAEMLRKLNRKVIVLDFDLRRPSVNKMFQGISNDVGLSVLLSGQQSLQECLQKTDTGIDVITAGPTPPNPSELIMSEGTDLLLQTLAKTYDYILIDTPPYSIVTDATILMTKVDIVLFSLMTEHSKRDAVKQFNNLIKKYNLEKTGIVYNGLTLKKQEKHGYGYFEN